VNYLAHAWTLGPGASPLLLLGAALPDLAAAFDRRAPRLARGEAERLRASEPLLARGVVAHQAADACFHALPAFKEGCIALRAAFGPLALERVRGFFLAHLLLEVLLDAALLESDRELAPRFYAALDEAPVDRVARLVAPGDPEGFERWVERFRRARFLLDYATDEGVAFRVEQVLNRARQTLGHEGAARLRAALPGLRERIRSETAALTAEPLAAVQRAWGP
jgi:hypothetical protein